jgi:ATP-dependent Clp protease ATP-binding subunit ClpC
MPELTVGADLAWRIAALEAQRGRAHAVGLDHLLVGLLSLDKLLVPSGGLSHNEHEAVQAEQAALLRALRAQDVDPAATRRVVRDHILPGRGTGSGTLQRDPACRAAFEQAEALARARGETAYGVLHLLIAILDRPSPTLVQALGDLDRLRHGVEIALMPEVSLSSASAPHAIVIPPPAQSPAPSQPPAPSLPPAPIVPRVPPILLQYGRDLTAEAEAGRLPPVIGRQDEMLQVVRVLHRRTKNGPVLIGEAGVGKTAIVEGLAQRIADGSVLPGRRIVALSIASVVAGTTYRGQFEERLEEILAALRSHPDVIFFLDEIHTIVGAGGADGKLDAAGILKPALARGEIACIGATTTDEYRQHIEGDPALERRFQPILVAEPTRADTLAILDGLRPELEQHHHVRIEPDALEAAVDLTIRYLASRRLPDKAVDALDDACARVSVPSLTGQRGPSLGPVDTAPVVSREIVAAVVSAWGGLEVGHTGRDARHRLSDLDASTRLSDLEARLGERIVGQSAAIRTLAARVRLARTGLSDPERPAGVVLLVGPRGVGKTALAVALAELLADGPGGEPSLIRLTMSDFAERQQMAGLFGTTGYAGRAQDGRLTGPLRRSPRAVVLLDEIERAHPSVRESLVPLLATGRLTDAAGRTIDAREVLFVLTTMVTGAGVTRRSLGFGSSAPGSPSQSDAVLSELRAELGSDLLGCVDEVVPLRSLGEGDLREIARRRVVALRERMLEHHEVDITVSDDGLALLARHAASGPDGTREVDRVITRLLAEPLSRELHAGSIRRGAHLLAVPNGAALSFRSADA